MKKILLYISPVLTLSVFLLWFFSDTQIIKRRTSDIFESLQLEQGTTRLERVSKSQQLGSALDSDITVTYPPADNLFRAPIDLSEPITITKDRAVTSHAYLTESLDLLKAENIQTNITSITDTTATVEVSFDLTAKPKNGPQKSTNLQGTFTFTKTQKKWLLSQATFPPKK